MREVHSLLEAAAWGRLCLLLHRHALHGLVEIRDVVERLDLILREP